MQIKVKRQLLLDVVGHRLLVNFEDEHAVAEERSSLGLHWNERLKAVELSERIL